MSIKKDNSYTPLQIEDHIPKTVKRLLNKILDNSSKNIILYGFSINMKWLFRILKKKRIRVTLCDWRDNFSKYDCGGKKLIHIDKINDNPKNLIVVCIEEINLLKLSIRYLIKNNKKKTPIIYDRELRHNPIEQEEPYKGIYDKAILRARSMISKEQLFDLIQFVDQTKNINGDILEFGSLYGGSGAIIAEAIKVFGKKKLWLFDSFSGIPKSNFGLDYCWTDSFSDNSFSEVSAAFADLEFVKVVNGNICKTYKKFKGKISFGYLASDTLETGIILLNFMWKKLSVGGVLAVCDYGSYPNCLPLTTYVDDFFEKRKDAFIYKPDKSGFFARKI
jgi:O-methyltransferase